MRGKICIYSLPTQKTFQLVLHKEYQNSVISFYPFEGKSNVEFCSNEVKILEKNELLSTNLSFELLNTSNSEQFIEEENYIETIESLKNSMQEKDVSKVVFSRKKKIEKRINPIKTLIKLRDAYLNAFCYLMQEENGEIWFGATPETLLSEDANAYHTMSLAGTLPIDEEWTDKEIKEQQAVTNYISESLIELQSTFKVGPLENLNLGEIKHLIQSIEIVKTPNSFDVIVEKLHPTPAVCGVPKNEAEKLIHQFEDYNRKLYTGYIKLTNQGKQYAFVNLRCGQIFKDEVHLYIGGGITLDSVPEKEWKETEMKANSLSQFLV